MPMKGADKHLARLRKLASPDVIRVAGQVVFEGADIIRGEAFRLVSTGSSSGKSGGKHQHVRSKPGEPPNREDGDLQAGFKTAQTGPVSAEFRSEAPHARPLEFGTSKMAARPHIRVARDAKEKQIRKRMIDQMNKLVERSG